MTLKKLIDLFNHWNENADLLGEKKRYLQLNGFCIENENDLKLFFEHLYYKVKKWVTNKTEQIKINEFKNMIINAELEQVNTYKFYFMSTMIDTIEYKQYDYKIDIKIEDIEILIWDNIYNDYENNKKRDCILYELKENKKSYNKELKEYKEYKEYLKD